MAKPTLKELPKRLRKEDVTLGQLSELKSYAAQELIDFAYKFYLLVSLHLSKSSISGTVQYHIGSYDSFNFPWTIEYSRSSEKGYGDSVSTYTGLAINL